MTVLNHSMPLLNGQEQNLADYQGKVVLIANTASECGFTYQYEGLEALYQKYRERGLVVLGFPCNQFGAQEKGDNASIGAFCQKNFGVTFPVFSKIDVNGPAAAPLFVQLKREAPGILGTQRIKWNFTKFLIGRDGRVYRRYATATRPEKLMADIEKLLGDA